jgi:hypothetical protein
MEQLADRFYESLLLSSSTSRAMKFNKMIAPEKVPTEMKEYFE